LIVSVEAVAGPGVDVDDVLLAARFHLPLLISAPTIDSALAVAKQVHRLGFGDRAPLLLFAAAEFSDGSAFEGQWSTLVNGGLGGTVVFIGLEDMTAGVQMRFMESLDKLGAERPPAIPRCIGVTTVSLLQKVTTGEFLEPLFYRLNGIHVVIQR
jgi:hypothetical protein